MIHRQQLGVPTTEQFSRAHILATKTRHKPPETPCDALTCFCRTFRSCMRPPTLSILTRHDTTLQ